MLTALYIEIRLGGLKCKGHKPRSLIGFARIESGGEFECGTTQAAVSPRIVESGQPTLSAGSRRSAYCISSSATDVVLLE